MSISFFPRLVSLALLALVAAAAGAQDLAETPGPQSAFRTAPDFSPEFKEDELWSTRSGVAYSDLTGGVKLATDRVKAGKYSDRWADHPRFPTLHLPLATADWSGFGGLSFWAWSDVATGEKIAVALDSDDPATAWRDYLLCSFSVDWTGWRELTIPFKDFTPLGQPQGLQQVRGLYFFTKVFNRQPNPGTVLYLDALRPVAASTVSYPPVALPATPAGKLPLTSDAPLFDPSQLNHPWEELPAKVLAPLQYQSYFNHERALHGYYPRFEPGFVSFDPQGKAYLNYGGYVLQWLGADGKWQYRDLYADVIEPFAREKLGYKSVALGNSGQVNEGSLAFDNDGGVYMMTFIAEEMGNWRSRKALLLYSPDGLKTWQAYLLPEYEVRFEKFVGHNRDGLKRSPVILLSHYLSPTAISFVLPEKQADGTLLLPPPVKVHDKAMAWIPHSGEANNVLTLGDKLFLTYSTLEILPGKQDADGAPAYAVSYDLKTKQLSDPVLIGFGGRNAGDDHNWSALCVDSKGFLQVLINGHHAPYMSSRSVRPLDISEWTKPESVAVATSYGGLVCDSRDTLYTVTRNSDPGYYFRLSLHRRLAGRDWEEPRHLAIPFKPYYKVWMHKLVIEPVRERLFLAYWSQTPAECLFKDEYLAALFIWPDREQLWLTKSATKAPPLGTYKQEPRKYAFYNPPPTEPCILVSEDRGETWHLATTDDFR